MTMMRVRIEPAAAHTGNEHEYNLSAWFVTLTEGSRTRYCATTTCRENALMPALLSNNSISRLAVSINSNDLEISVSAGDGAKFPALSGSDWFPLTLIKASGATEILKATARNGDVITVVRAQDGTTSQAFTAGDRAELRLTAGVMNGKLDTSGGTVTGPLTLTADFTTWRPADPATGAIFFGSTNTKYLFYDGANYALAGGGLTVNGQTAWTSGNFNPASYLPLAGGNLTGQLGIYNTSPTMMFYDTDWGPRQLHCNGGLIGFLTSGGGWGCYSNNDGSFIASGNIGAYSDRKHKIKISTIKRGLEIVEGMRGVRYVDKRNGSHRVGVIAQEMQGVLPEVVGESPDGLYVDYGNLAAPLIEAVKELSARIRKLEGQ